MYLVLCVGLLTRTWWSRVLFCWPTSLTTRHTQTTAQSSCCTALRLIITWWRCSTRPDCSASSPTYLLTPSTAQPLSSR